MTSKSAKRASIALRSFGRRGPRLGRRQTQRRRRAARNRAGDFQRLNGPWRPRRCRGFIGHGPADTRLPAAGRRTGSAKHPGRRRKADLAAVPAAAHGWARSLSRRRFLRPGVRAAGLNPWDNHQGIRLGCQPGTAYRTDNQPCTRTIAWQERHAVRWWSPSWQPRQATYRLKLKFPSYGFYRAWQT